MNQFAKQRLEQIDKEGFKLDFEAVFSEGFQIWKKTTLPIVGGIILVIIPILFIFGALYPLVMGFTYTELILILKENPMKFKTLTTGLIPHLKVTGLGILMSIFSAPMYGGFLKLCHQADTKGFVNFSTLFSGYKAPYFLNLGAAGILIGIISSLPGILVQQIPIVGGLIYYLFMFIISILTVYVNSLIIFADASPLEALQISAKLAFKNLGLLAAIFLVSFLLMLLGLFACCIGILFTATFAYVMFYLIYKQTIGFETTPEDTSTTEISTSY